MSRSFIIIHQLERLSHAHEAQVCAGDLSCEDDGSRQPMSWSVYRSAWPIAIKRRGVRLNYEEFLLHNTAVTNRQCEYTIYNMIYNYSNSSCPFQINHNNNGAAVLESKGCSTWSFQMPCQPGDALCGLPVNPSDVWWQHSDLFGGDFKTGVINETNRKRKRPEK